MALNKAQIIGFFAVGVGITLLCFVGYVGWQKFQPQTYTARDVNGVEAEEPSVLIAAPESATRSLKAESIVGRWVNDQRTIYLAMKSGQYDLVLLADTDGIRRLYSRGAYRYDARAETLRLTPDPRMKAPDVRGNEFYRVLTMRPYEVSIRADKEGHMIWLPYGFDGARDQFHPVFTYKSKTKNPVIWNRQ